MGVLWLGLVICVFARVTDAVGPLRRTVCLFEDSECGWTDDSASPNWSYERAISGVLSRDHTLGTNSGRYQRFDPRTTSQTSRYTNPRPVRFTSPRFPPDDRYCIQFWYKLYGANRANINVYAQVYGGRGYPVRSFNSSGSSWTLAEIEIDSEYTGANFNFVIETTTLAYKTYRYSSSRRIYTYYNEHVTVAFDDIYIVNRGCRALPNCPEGFEVLETESSDMLTCVQFQTNATSWTEAVKQCRFLSPYGHLVNVEDAAKERQIVRYINANNAFRAAAVNGVWTSGTDYGNEGTWFWTDKGTPVRLTYKNWRPGQPNNVGSRQHCLSLNYPQLAYQWGDEYCELSKPYICQIHLNTTRQSSAGTSA